MSGVRRKSILVNLVLLVTSLVVSALLGEILLRRKFTVNEGASFQHRIPHPVFGWVLERGASYVNRIPEVAVNVEYNSEGCRDVEHSVSNPHRTFRVLVLGDSFMEAYSVGLNEAFHKQLERFARRSGIEIEAMNFGVGGYGTLQEYLVFRDVAEPYGAELVLLGFYLNNDVRNNSLELEALLETGSMKVASRPFLDPAAPEVWRITQVDFEGAQRRYSTAKARHDSFFGKLKRRSALVQAIRSATSKLAGMSSTKKRQFSENQDDKEHPADREKSSLAAYGINYCDEPPEYTRAWDTTLRILERLKNDVEAAGSKLAVFMVPAFHEVDASAMSKVMKKVPDPAMLCLEEAPGYERLKDVLGELDIEYIDLLPDFRTVMRDGGTNLFRRDGHWNPEGHSLAARLVVSSLVEKGLLQIPETDRATQ